MSLSRFRIAECGPPEATLRIEPSLPLKGKAKKKNVFLHQFCESVVNQ
jgi:hypothetical protein